MPDEKYYIQEEEESIDIMKYVYLILGHWWWFAISIFIAFTIAYLVNRYSQEEYQSSCSIIVGEPEAAAGSVESMLDEFNRYNKKKRKAVVENEISILKSYKLARTALEELDFEVSYTAIGRRNIAERQLYHECPFYVKFDTTDGKIVFPGPYYVNILSDDEYLIKINEENSYKFNFDTYNELGNTRLALFRKNNFFYKPSGSNKYSFKYNDVNILAKKYSNGLSVDVNAEKGSILSLSLNGFVPGKIANYLNKLSEVYIRSNLNEKNIASVNTIEFIDDQLRGIVDSLESTSLRLQKFRSENKVIDISKEGSFLFEKVQSLQSEKAMLDINSRYYNYLLEYIEKKRDFSDLAAPSVVGIQDPLLNKLVGTLNELNLDWRNISMSVVANSPQAIQLQNEIKNTHNALQENLESLIASNEIAKTELNERITAIESELQKLPGTERQLIDIEREFTINDQIYTFLLEKRAEAGITRASNTSDHKILDIARPENVSRIKPKTSSNLMMAIAAGGIIPVVLLLMLDFFNNRITDRRQIENNIKLPIMGNIGHSDITNELPVNENPRSSFSESFRALRTNIQYILKEPKSKIIAVSSAVSGEGKTFCSVNLATILAMADKKVLIVSLDLRRPKVHKVFNMENESGLSTYLINKTTYTELVKETNINNLSIVTSGPIPPNPTELIGRDKMREFIDLARKEFDYIILDTPPIGIVTDTLALKPYWDTFLFVIRHNYSNKQVIELINKLKEQKIIESGGIVINDIQLRGYYGYSYKYGYGYGYSYQYNNSYYSEEKEKFNLLNYLKNKHKV